MRKMMVTMKWRDFLITIGTLAQNPTTILSNGKDIARSSNPDGNLEHTWNVARAIFSKNTMLKMASRFRLRIPHLKKGEVRVTIKILENGNVKQHISVFFL